MASNSSILQLPDLVLYNICTFIDCPFDLLHFGNTCSRLRKIASNSSLWWSLAFRVFRGLWLSLEEYTTEENPRNWLLEMVRLYSKGPKITTRVECQFSNGELWQRVDSTKFRFLVNLMRVAYTRDKDEHPAVLYEKWLYDIGLYTRVGPFIDFAIPNLEITESMVQQLSTLGQAAERDLRRRKQPYKDNKYYIKVIASSGNTWMSDLFPEGPCGSLCPLLISPFQNYVTNESSGIQGLAMCFSVVFERYLQRCYKKTFMPLSTVWRVVKEFSVAFTADMFDIIPILKSRLQVLSLNSAILIIIEEDLYDFKQLQKLLELSCLNITPKVLIHDLATFLRKYGGVDFAVDEIRSRFQNSINKEAKNILFSPESLNHIVTRINLTDSDLIGGDNSRQEMAAAAFVSNNGVLVTWHLIGRMRY